ncbi:MAG TPA: superoxide dismutase [Cu-Zn] SodC [Usitatibacter sp.]|nr:superoxide dismutase [Cu-Zn] SodC [Usitatibacter sp.]
MNRFRFAMMAVALASAGAARAQQAVEMNAIDIKGVGAPIGTVLIKPAPQGGVLLTPDLKGLPPGEHGFHLHEFANCGARQKDGKMSAGELAGDHYDPKKTQKHAGPQGEGHMGDLPPLKVDAQGNARQAVVAPRLALKDLRNKSLVIHEGGDNASDQPKPNGGGGTRIACGVIGEK